MGKRAKVRLPIPLLEVRRPYDLSVDASTVRTRRLGSASEHRLELFR